MFRLNLKIAFRNLYKYKGYTFINIGGLALGMAGFIFMLLYVNHERNYDTWHEELKNIYQVQELDLFSLTEGKAEWMSEADVRLKEIIKTGMPVAGVTHLSETYDEQSIVIGKQEPFLVKDIHRSDRYFFDVFPYDFVYGDAATAFDNPQNMVVTEDFSRKHFGDANPIGQTVKVIQQAGAKTELYQISGVVAKPKSPSVIDFTILIQSKVWAEADQFLNFMPIYVRFRPGHDPEDLTAILQKLYEPFRASMIKKWKRDYSEYTKNGHKPAVRLRSFYSLHQDPLKAENWFALIKPVLLLSSLLLLISIINFINMATAQAASRAKEIGIRKVAGADRKGLILQFLLETALQCFAALVFAVVLLELFLPYINTQFSLSLSILSGYRAGYVVVQLVALCLIIALLAGFYPALFLSAYEPQQVLKGNFVKSRSGIVLRNILVGMQFVIAVGFFIGIMVISMQLKYMQSRDPGFNAEGLIYINEAFDEQMGARMEEIDGIYYTGEMIGTVRRNLRLNGRYKYKNESRDLETVLTSMNGLQAVGAKLLKGRFFNPENKGEAERTIVVNECLEKLYGGNMLGKYFVFNDTATVQVIGVVKDIQAAGFEELIVPTVYTAAKNNATGYPVNSFYNHLVRYDPGKEREVLSEISKLWKQRYPNFPLNYTFLEEDFKKLLVPHERFKQMVKFFSLLSISLSLIGLFSLVAFTTRQRIKEIAIRKVMGASDKELFLLLNKGYLWLVLAANTLAWPIIYIALKHWLSGYAYRIDLPLLPFFIGFVASLLVTIITVSFQVRRAVQGNPVDALRYE